MRHGPNKFEHYGLLQAVSNNDYAAYVQHLEVAMRRMASMHLARDLSRCKSVVEILAVVSEHQASTGRVRKLETEVDGLREELEATRKENASLRRELRRLS